MQTRVRYAAKRKRPGQTYIFNPTSDVVCLDKIETKLQEENEEVMQEVEELMRKQEELVKEAEKVEEVEELRRKQEKLVEEAIKKREDLVQAAIAENEERLEEMRREIREAHCRRNLRRLTSVRHAPHKKK